MRGFLVFLLAFVVGTGLFMLAWGSELREQPFLLLVWCIMYPLCILGALGGMRRRR